VRGLHFLPLSRSNRVQLRSLQAPTVGRVPEVVFICLQLRCGLPYRLVSIVAPVKVATTSHPTTPLPNLVTPRMLPPVHIRDRQPNFCFQSTKGVSTIVEMIACRNPVASYFWSSLFHHVTIIPQDSDLLDRER
jgi:hypothetical protein